MTLSDLVKIWHEASRGLSATAELLVFNSREHDIWSAVSSTAITNVWSKMAQIHWDVSWKQLDYGTVGIRLRRLDHTLRRPSLPASECFAVLRQLRSVRRSVPRSVLQSPVTSLVLTRLDHRKATLAGIPLYLLKRLQSVMNSAAWLVFSSSKYEHITPLLRHYCRVLSLSDCKYSLNQLSQTRID